MKVTPKTEDQIAEEGLFPKGEYHFEIIDQVDAISKKTNAEMIKLTLAIFNDNDEKIFIDDYLLDAIPYKVRHAAAACGVLDKYESGELVAQDFMGAQGRCKLGIKIDKTGQYRPQNNVTDYIVAKTGSAPEVLTTMDDDPLPF